MIFLRFYNQFKYLIFFFLAHCTVGIITGEVWGGVLNINLEDPIYYGDLVRSNFIVHAAYNPSNQANDIALIRLPTLINFNGKKLKISTYMF